MNSEMKLVPADVKNLIAVWFWCGMCCGVTAGIIVTIVVLTVTGEIR